jgi:exopolysaccharide biosynthesis polyprenyl glycosylphosphotransferase
MKTASGTRTWLNGRRRRAAPLPVAAQAARQAVISPVWEVQPRGHSEIGMRKDVVRRDSLLRRSLGAADVVSATLALVLSTVLIDPGRVHLQLMTVAVIPFVLLVGKLLGLYDRDSHLVRKTTLDEAPALGYLSVVFALGTWLGESALLNGYLVRPQVFALVMMMFLLTSLTRLGVRRLALALTDPERILVLGNGLDAARIAAKFASSPSVKAEVVGRVALHAGAARETPAEGVPTLGGYEDLCAIVSDCEVERVIIAPHSDGQDEILDAIRLIKALGVKVSVLPRLLEVVGSTSTFDDIDGLWLLGVRQFGLARTSELIKRAADVIVAGGAVIVLGPLFVILTLAIKLDTRGPVFFRQSRIGRKGDRFDMLKFRSMVPDAEARKAELRAMNEAQGGLFKIEKDPRITRVGGLLRTTSLDELPQLLNVLKGDMSLVGPRPLVPDEDRLIEGWQRRRLAVKPGMTGLWQIFGSSRIPMHEMVKIDYIYGANWSLWLDLRILLRTVPYVLSRRGQ